MTSPSSDTAAAPNPATPPKTPTKPTTTGPAVRVTLPTPPSFSARKAAQRSAESTIHGDTDTLASTGNEEAVRHPGAEGTRPGHGDKIKKGHNRSVSFNLPDLSPITPSDGTPSGDSPPATGTGIAKATPNSAPLTSTGKYRIPQRSGAALTSVSGGVIAPTSLPLTALPGGRRGPPKALNLGPSLATASSPRIKTAAGAVGGSKSSTGFSTPGTAPTRWSTTAAARGLSLNPSALNQNASLGSMKGNGSKRHSTSMAGSIWSAALPSLGETSGWISPALASARSVLGSGRTRGLTVAVLNEQGGKELLIETLPTPGLPRLPTGGDGEHDKEKKIEDSDEKGVDAVGKEKSVPGTPQTGSSIRPREIILCRYYHTPGLTCTSRPCRFVHALDKLNLSPESDINALEMRTPRTALLTGTLTGKSDMSTTSNGSNGNKNPHPEVDPTSGTFAAHQIQSRMKTLTIKDVDEKGIEPGERVTVSSPGGQEVPGLVFLMSGGGKGAVGKSKIKFKTEQCRDYAAGHCPYGDYCSFLHGETSRTPEPKSTGTIPSPSKVPGDDAPGAETKAFRRRSYDAATVLKTPINAWKAGPPGSSRPSPLKLDQSNIAKADAKQKASAHAANEQTAKLGRDGAPLSAVPKFAAFAVPFTRKNVEVDEKGDIVPAPASARLPVAALAASGVSSTFSAAQKGLAVTKENVNPTGPAPTTGRSALSGAWRKGAPKTTSTVRIIEPPRSVPSAPGSDGASSGNDNEPLTPLGPSVPLGAQTLTIPHRSAWGGLGSATSATDSDPATPWDPALRAARMRDMDGEDEEPPVTQQNMSYADGTYTYGGYDPTTNAPWSAGPDFGERALYYGSEAQGQDGVQYPCGTQTYPWGMPMSPVGMNALSRNEPAQTKPGPEGGLGVMWTPSGWAVQDAAMKMALFSAEAKAAGHEIPGEARNYWRTKKCRFFAQGVCPHGDACTFIHSSSNSISPPRLARPNPKAKTQPCKFFNSAIGCHNADACTFLHTRVVPDSVPLVEKPRPWRTRPCRHFQVGRCHLGDACHFAHVYEAPQKVGYGGEYLTEARLERAMKEMHELRAQGAGAGDDSDDDDIEIVTTGDNSLSYSLSRSHSGSTIVSRPY